jgi:hypothetical protein
MKPIGILLGLLISPFATFAQDSGEDSSSASSAIGYDSVQQAFDAVSTDPGASRSEYEGWELFTQKDNGKYILWSFTPEDHPVHPSAVRREVVRKDGEVFITMGVLCHSSRFDCDQLVEQFRQINARMKQRLEADPG